MLLSLPTEVLLQITDYLPAYDKLCLRISCRRFYSLLSDPRAWSSLVWKNCRRRDPDFKTLKLALELSRSYVQFVQITESQRFPNARFFPEIVRCKQIRYISLTGTFSKYIWLSLLDFLLRELRSLYCLTVTGNETSAIMAARVSKSLQVLRIYPEDAVCAVKTWKMHRYMPPNLKLYCCHVKLASILPYLTSSDHPAHLSIYPNSSPVAGNVVNKHPIIRWSLYPNVELLTCPTASVCSTASQSSDLIVSHGNSFNQDPVSATVCSESLNGLAHTITMPLLPSSIESLFLAGTEKLSPFDLTLVSELCPKLACLDIQGCTNALSSLLGLADISSNCAGLAALNIDEIHNIENVSSLWEILSRMRKLRYLSVSYSCVAIAPTSPFDERCVSRMKVSLAQMNLFAIDISKSVYNENLQVEILILLPAFRMLQHLQITINKRVSTLDLTNVLPNLPSLTQLFVVLPDSGNGHRLMLPTDPDCYSSLKKLSIRCQQFDVSDDLALSLSQSPSLMYLQLYVGSCPLLIDLLANFRRLYECYVRCFGRDHAGVNRKRTLSNYGLCGFVNLKKPFIKQEVLF